jgi:pseudouridine synthase
MMCERLILLNKPYNVLCQFTDDTGTKRTLADYLPVRGVYPAGRLDYDSEGLVILTNAGWLQHRIANPAWKEPKTHWAQVEGIPDDAALARLASGVELNDVQGNRRTQWRGGLHGRRLDCAGPQETRRDHQQRTEQII